MEHIYNRKFGFSNNYLDINWKEGNDHLTGYNRNTGMNVHVSRNGTHRL